MRAASLAAGLCVILGCAPAVVRASLPGTNGQLAFTAGTSVNGRDLYAINPDGTGPRPLSVVPGQDIEPSWSPDGERIAWVSDSVGQIALARADGLGRFSFVPSRQAITWSPDGRSIAFASGRETAGITEIFVADASTGGNRRRLTFRPEQDNGPDWSPDGTKIVWHSFESGSTIAHIYVMNADGSDQHRLFPSRTAADFEPAWSPDGSQILWTSFVTSAPKHHELWVANADGTSPRRIVTDSELIVTPTWSPDGTRIAYSQRRKGGGNVDLIVSRPDGTGASAVIAQGPFGFSVDWQPVPDHGAQPVSAIADGGAEDGFGGFFTQPAYLIPRWTTNGGMSVLRYGLSVFPKAESLPVLTPAGLRQRPVLRGPIGGKRFFFGGNQEVSTAVQTFSLAAPAAELDSGEAMGTLSGLLGGRDSERDEGTVTATLLDGAGTAIGGMQIGPVSPSDRGGATKFVSRMQTAKLPAGTRSVRITLTATRHTEPFNDAYFDNLAFVYTKPAETPPTKPPDPVEPPPTKPPGTPGATTTTAPDLGAPGAVAPVAGAGRLSRLRLTPNRFAVAKGDTATIAARRRARRGSRIRFTLQRAGMVTMDIARLRRGRRAVVVTTLLRNGRAGANSVRFTGRFRGKRLAAGRYLLGASTTDAQGKRTKSVGVRFRIVRR